MAEHAHSTPTPTDARSATVTRIFAPDPALSERAIKIRTTRTFTAATRQRWEEAQKPPQTELQRKMYALAAELGIANSPLFRPVFDVPSKRALGRLPVVTLADWRRAQA